MYPSLTPACAHTSSLSLIGSPCAPLPQNPHPACAHLRSLSYREHLCTALAGYHPSRRPVGTAYDRFQIGTKTARTSVEWIPGLRQSAYLAVAPGAAWPHRRPNTAVGGSVAASKMPKSRSWGVGMHLRRPGHSRAPPRLAQAPRLAHGPIAGNEVSGVGVVSSDLHGGRSRCARRPPPWHLGDPVGCAGRLRRVPRGARTREPHFGGRHRISPCSIRACGARALPARTTDVAQDPYPF